MGGGKTAGLESQTLLGLGPSCVLALLTPCFCHEALCPSSQLHLLYKPIQCGFPSFQPEPDYLIKSSVYFYRLY